MERGLNFWNLEAALFTRSKIFILGPRVVAADRPLTKGKELSCRRKGTTPAWSPALRRQESRSRGKTGCLVGQRIWRRPAFRLSPKSREFCLAPIGRWTARQSETVRPRITPDMGSCSPLRLHKTDPKLRLSRRFHDFLRENSDGIFDGISTLQPKIIQSNQWKWILVPQPPSVATPWNFRIEKFVPSFPPLGKSVGWLEQ